MTGKIRLELLDESNAVIHLMSTHTDVRTGGAPACGDTHLLMLRRSWRAASTAMRGLAREFPWRPVQRSWSLDPERPEFLAFWRVWHNDGTKPAPVYATAF